MWKRICAVLILFTWTSAAAQLNRPLQDSSIQTIEYALQRAYAAQQIQADTFALQTRAQKDDKSWQLALFLAARNRSISETLDEIKGQMNWGPVKLAAVLDLTPTGNTSTTKCTCEKGNCKKPLAAPSQITLYVLYRTGIITRQDTYTLDLSDNPARLWGELLKYLKAGQSAYQTGVIIDAHASGYNFFYGKEESFSSQQLVQSLTASRLHVDVLELHSCHMSSLKNVYQWTKNAQIDYVVASSDISLSSNTTMYYRVLRFLQNSPRQAAISSVRDRMKIFDFKDVYNTNNAVALQLSILRRPIQNYATQYKELLSYEGTEEMEKIFEGYFTEEFYDWHSLRNIVEKQKKYVQTHLEPQADAFYETQQQFVAASDKLLNALPSATLAQWCYSKKDHKVYQGQAPASSGCLESVSTTQAQFWSFYE